MNVWNFTGNLGKDSEVKYTQSGTAICSFSVAVKSGYGDNEKTTWVNCVLFGKRAEGKLPEYLIKGAQVAISGECFLDEWEKDGVKNKALKVTVDKLDLIGGRAEAASAPENQPRSNSQGYASDGRQYGTDNHQGASSSPSPQAAPSQPVTPSMENFDDSEIPFFNPYKYIEYIV